ncbi:diacylglycerol kinase catalytic region [Kyrpidia tusciae DSM 2912]|uniref:Diacylglycerol kinase catalytic region n=2 Tax=Kyrpidia TaxID=1129704 RepID=D5WXD6_KYRT2|nr:diacylglycerol kinase catalytic region [Kyrpidia tusciae DSM 2912]
MVMERWLFVVNPVAGKGKAARRWNRYYRHLATLGKHWDVYHTKSPGDATWIAKKTVEDRAADVVVAVGGDGTIHEVIQGLAGSSIALGILPAGTGNDLARYFGIKKGLRAIRQLQGAIKRQVDLVQTQSGVFINIAGTGFDAWVARHVNNSVWLKRWGPFGYVVGVAVELLFFRPQRVDIEVDGTLYTYRSAWLVALGNGSTYAGGMRILPDATMEDGELDLCVVDGLSKPEFCLIFPKVFTGKHVGHPSVHLHRGKRICIHPATPWPVHADGEVLPQETMEAMVWPGSLTVLCPAP